jgi:deoxycytidine triphosphate deaminase
MKKALIIAALAAAVGLAFGCDGKAAKDKTVPAADTAATAAVAPDTAASATDTAACLTCCGGKGAEDKPDTAADTTETTRVYDDDCYNKVPPLPKTSVSKQLPDEDYLVESLEEYFTIYKKENPNPVKHWLLDNFMDTTMYGGRQFKELVGEKERKALSGIKSVSVYWMRDELNRLSLGKTKTYDLRLEILKFDNKDNARVYFNLMNKAARCDDFFIGNLPVVFFLASGTDGLYFFVTRSWNRIPYILLAQTILINRCFLESEVHFFNPGFGKNWDVLKLNSEGGAAPE